MMYYFFNQLSKKMNQKLDISEELTLHNKNITFYPEISKLFMVKNLSLYGCSLTVIPSCIGNMINLKKLDLSKTNISELPKEIGLLIKLKSFSMIGNSITILPKEIGLLNKLIYLDCSHNLLTSLPKEICCLTKLKRLYLHANKISSLPDMTPLINLKDISLCENDLTSKILLQSHPLNYFTLLIYYNL